MTPQQISQARVEKSWSRAKLAKKAGMSEFTVWRFENGHRVSELYVNKMIDALKQSEKSEQTAPVAEGTQKITIKGKLLNPFTRVQLVELRKALNLNQFQLSKKLGISPASLAKWESGRSIPTQASIANLQKFFKPYITLETPKSDPVMQEVEALVKEVTETAQTDKSSSLKKVVTSISQMALVLAVNLKPTKFYGINYVGSKCIVLAVDHNYRVLNLTTMKWLSFFETNSLERLGYLVEQEAGCEMIQVDTAEELYDWVVRG